MTVMSIRGSSCVSGNESYGWFADKNRFVLYKVYDDSRYNAVKKVMPKSWTPKDLSKLTVLLYGGEKFAQSRAIALLMSKNGKELEKFLLMAKLGG